MLRLLIGAGLLSLAVGVRADDIAAIRSLNERGEHAAALLRAEAATAAAPRDAEPRFQQAVALMGLRRDVEAMKVFTGLTQQYPELPDPWNNIALLHARAGRLEQAREALLNALRNDPAHRAARANLGQIYQALAIEAWARAAADSPMDMAVQSRLAAARAVLAPSTAAPGLAASGAN